MGKIVNKSNIILLQK